jgi:hypothetical protein
MNRGIDAILHGSRIRWRHVLEPALTKNGEIAEFVFKFYTALGKRGSGYADEE